MFWSGEIICQKGDVEAVCGAGFRVCVCVCLENILINLGVQKVGEGKATGSKRWGTELSYSKQEFIHKNSISNSSRMF